MRNAIVWLVLVLAACGEGTPAELAPDGGEDGAACGAVLTPRPAAWTLLFDRSASWNQRLDRFEGLRDATKAFAAAHPEVALGLVEFARDDGGADACEAVAYRRLAVGPAAPVGTLAATLDALAPGGASPLAPAIAGAGTSARGGQATDERAHAVVVLTDATPGEDEVCGTWDDAAAAAADVFDAGRAPGVPVNVVSVMGRAVSAEHLGRLSAIAEAGGGYAAFVNGSRAEVAASTATVLGDLLGRQSCVLEVPAGGPPPSELAIEFPDGEVTVATRVPDASACHAGGFFLDDPTEPRSATLCSGVAGVGGLCERTFLRARIAGPPTIRAASCAAAE